jgi:hypothetical protein
VGSGGFLRHRVARARTACTARKARAMQWGEGMLELMKARPVIVVAPIAALLACSSPQTGETPPTTSTTEPATEPTAETPQVETAAPTETAIATATASAAPSASTAARDVTVPPESADYSAALADAKAYKKGAWSDGSVGGPRGLG